MIVGNQNWQQALNQQVKQPLYVFEIPDFGIVLATFSTESGNVNVGGYYPGDFWSDLRQTLAWLYARQNAPIRGWQGNALLTPTGSAQFAECGIVSTPDFSTFPQIPLENIVLDPPPGVIADLSPGPDGFPINFSPQALPTGSLLLNTFENSARQNLTGRCFSLLQPFGNYRVDVFARTDVFYYQGSSPLASLGNGSAAWGPVSVGEGVVMATLYPASLPQPAPGASFSTLPPRWLAHSNLGVGKALKDYYARIYSKTDVEYFEEDRVPIIVQDAHHARCGSSAVSSPGVATVHLVYQDPVAGPTVVFTSRQNLAVYKDLPRSFDVPASDPFYVPDVTASNVAALQNRSFTYDCALAMIAYSVAGNFAAALKIGRQINVFLDNPGYLASHVLENAEDGSIGRWSASSSGTIGSLNDPAQPPYGAGLVLKFQAQAAGATFTYTGSGLSDFNDSYIQFQHKEDESVSFCFNIGVSCAAGSVSQVRLTSAPTAPSTYDSSTKAISVAIGLGEGQYRTTLIDLNSLIARLAGDTLESINSFQVVLSAPGDLYFDNLSLGGQQPANSLSFSYDIYNGQVDQAYIRTGAMAWVCYAYAIYMALSLDYTPAPYLERMLNFLMSLRSSDPDLRSGLLYAGYGQYKDPGYQCVPGLQDYVSTEHNIDAYFALIRAAGILPVAATRLLKEGLISSVQAASLGATASAAFVTASGIAAALTTNLYIAPGNAPGRFAQGANSTGLDTSQALDASGTWAALFCHALGDDAKAAECVKFVYQNFYLQNQQILTSSSPFSFNLAYQLEQTFCGFKVYNDSSGGYSGSPAVVWQEGTWGMITALLRLHDVASVSSYFAGVEGSLDLFLTKLITGQRLIRAVTGNGSLLSYTLAARGLPYESTVWPSVGSTAWFWITAMNPGILLSTQTEVEILPYLSVPHGQGQSVSELDGSSSVGALEIRAIDPAAILKGLMAQDDLVGKTATFKMGFAGQSLGDFETLHTVQITSTGFTSDGQMTFQCSDPQRLMQGALLWTKGGPGFWWPGITAAEPLKGPALAPNAFAVSDQNPRWVRGNPLDIYLAAMQNELGVGQDPSLPVPAWSLYLPGHDCTLINPNPYLDVASTLALRDGPFSGDWFEFKITRPVEGKQWLEDQILKVLGLYTVVRPNGQLALKSMKVPFSLQPVMALNERNIVGLPSIDRLPVVNVVTVRMDVNDTVSETAGRQYTSEVTFVQTTSVARYKQQYQHQVEATGLRAVYGGNLRGFLLEDRIFRRHAFGTPRYRVRAFLSTLVVEVGDYVWLDHPLLPDFARGTVGLTNVVCQVVDRQPNYAEGYVEFEMLDMRFTKLTKPFGISPLSATVPVYSEASPAERLNYMFIALNSAGGLNADGTPANTIH